MHISTSHSLASVMPTSSSACTCAESMRGKGGPRATAGGRASAALGPLLELHPPSSLPTVWLIVSSFSYAVVTLTIR